MQIKRIIIPIALIITIVFVAGIALGGAMAKPPQSTALQNTFTYQGFLEDGGGPISDTCDLEFKLWDDISVGSQIGSTITLMGISVNEGKFSAQLDFGPGAFQGDDRFIEVGVLCPGDASFTTLTPRQPITPVPYAMFAMDSTPMENVITVAKSGGDFNTIQAAVDYAASQNPGPDNPFLVFIGPGNYYEQVTLDWYIDLQGSGENKTILTWHGSSSPDQGTLNGASNSQVRHLSINNEGGDAYAIGVYNEATGNTSYLHVDVQASGGSAGTYAFLNNGTTGFCNVTLEHVNSYTTGSPILRTIYYQGDATGQISHTGAYANSVDASADVIAIGLSQTDTYTWFNSIEIAATASGANSSAAGLWLDSNNGVLTLNDFNISADGTSVGDGVYLNQSGITLRNGVIKSWSETGTTAGINSISSSLDLSDYQIFADGNTAYGIKMNAGGGALFSGNIKIFSSGTGAGYGYYNQGSSSVDIRNVRFAIECSSCTAYGLWNQGGTYFSLEDVHASTNTSSTAVGVHLDGVTNAFIYNSIIRPGGTTQDEGVIANNDNGPCLVKIYNSVIGFADNATVINGSNTTMEIANSMLAGNIYAYNSANYMCIQNYAGDNSPVGCP